MTHGHFISKCKHGVVVAQCRCISVNKEVRIVPCPASCDEVLNKHGYKAPEQIHNEMIEK